MSHRLNTSSKYQWTQAGSLQKLHPPGRLWHSGHSGALACGAVAPAQTLSVSQISKSILNRDETLSVSQLRDSFSLYRTNSLCIANFQVYLESRRNSLCIAQSAARETSIKHTNHRTISSARDIDQAYKSYLESMSESSHASIRRNSLYSLSNANRATP